jgi:hypothetical protein
MEMLKVTDTAKIVTDPVLLAVLAGQGIAKDSVEMEQDYGPRASGTGRSPYAKFYRDLNSSRKFAVISGLPMVDAYGQKHELVWRDNHGIIENGNNIFHAVITGLDARLVALSDQPRGMKKDQEIFFHPQLFIGGSEVNPLSPLPRLLETDPVNGNYQNNVLEWDYGVCLRRIRLIEGRFLGAWVFLTNPRADVSIKYNQSGIHRLRLGPFAITQDEEYIPADSFSDPSFGFPFTISDTAAFYPDPDTETSSVDGPVKHSTGGIGTGIAWSSLVGAAGTDAYDALTVLYSNLYADNVSARWRVIFRSIVLFDTASLPDEATISNAVLSLYGSSKSDGLAVSPTVNIYSSNPASDTALEAADYTRLGTTAFSSDITYANWSVSGYNDFLLNSSGIASIANTGVSKFGFRNANYDVANSAPAWAYSANSGMAAYAAEQGAGYKPKLAVTYSTGESKTSSDAGSGAEAIAIRGIEGIEQANGAEVLVIAASIDAGDTGNGAEAIVIRGVEGNEQGSGVEASDMLASLSTGDAGSSSESSGTQATASSESVSAADSGCGTDTLKALVRQSGIDMKLYGNPGETGLPGKELHL